MFLSLEEIKNLEDKHKENAKTEIEKENKSRCLLKKTECEKLE